jgi:hypothetical protein
MNEGGTLVEVSFEYCVRHKGVFIKTGLRAGRPREKTDVRPAFPMRIESPHARCLCKPNRAPGAIAYVNMIGKFAV